MPTGVPGCGVLCQARPVGLFEVGEEFPFQPIAAAAQEPAEGAVGERAAVHRLEAPPGRLLYRLARLAEHGGAGGRIEGQRLEQSQARRRSTGGGQQRAVVAQAGDQTGGGLRRPPEAAGVHAYLAVVVAAEVVPARAMVTQRGEQRVPVRLARQAVEEALVDPTAPVRAADPG